VREIDPSRALLVEASEAKVALVTAKDSIVSQWVGQWLSQVNRSFAADFPRPDPALRVIAGLRRASEPTRNPRPAVSI
jgi:hypothetical protein